MTLHFHQIHVPAKLPRRRNFDCRIRRLPTASSLDSQSLPAHSAKDAEEMSMALMEPRWRNHRRPRRLPKAWSRHHRAVGARLRSKQTASSVCSSWRDVSGSPNVPKIMMIKHSEKHGGPLRIQVSACIITVHQIKVTVWRIHYTAKSSHTKKHQTYSTFPHILREFLSLLVDMA